MEEAGLAASMAEHCWAKALTELDNAVLTAKEVGIPKQNVPHLARVRTTLGGATSEKLRAMIRRIYS